MGNSSNNSNNHPTNHTNQKTHYLIDIGNTRIKCQRFVNVNVARCNERGLKIGETHCFTHKESSDFFEFLNSQPIEKLTIARVRPMPVTQQLQAFAKENDILLSDICVNSELLKVNYAEPEKFGVDRYLALLAGRKYYGSDFCVVSAGSAITVDFFSDHHLGGMILPGIGTSLANLTQKTGLSYQHIEAIDSKDKPTIPLLGTDTSSSILAGIYYGYARLVYTSVDDLSSKYKIPFKILLTGGDAKLIYHYGQRAGLIAPDLVFDGMRVYLNYINQETPSI